MKSMLNFVQTIPDKNLHQASIDEFNRLMDIEYNCIRDFVVLHYCASKRSDSPFWKMWQNLELPESLKIKLDLFNCHGRLYNNKLDLFSQDSWYAVLEGMHVRPSSYDPTIDASIFNKVEDVFPNAAQALIDSAGKVLTHDDFIARLISK